MPYIGYDNLFTVEEIAALPESPILKESVIAWALKLPYAKNVARRDSSCGCPLAEYLKALGHTNVVVDQANAGYGYQGGAGMVYFRHNEFTKSFVIDIDTCRYCLPEDKLRCSTAGWNIPVSRLELLIILGVYQNPEHGQGNLVAVLDLDAWES